MMMGRFVWYELMTPDPAAAADFYAKVVGWEIEVTAMTGAEYRLLKTEGQQVAGILATADDVGGEPARWYGYVGVEDVDAAADTLVAGGGTMFRAPADIPNVGRFAVVADPHGVPFMLFTGAGDPPPLAPYTTGTISWHELHTPDREAAFAFYAGQFGWEKDALRDSPIGPIQFIRAGSDEANGAMLESPMKPGWIFYFVVADIDAASRAITDNGGSIMHGPTPVPNGGFITLATDPQGAIFELVGRKKG
jgi:predicted enzyme related to lactoylglutathione lyase